MPPGQHVIEKLAAPVKHQGERKCQRGFHAAQSVARPRRGVQAARAPTPSGAASTTAAMTTEPPSDLTADGRVVPAAGPPNAGGPSAVTT